MEDGTRHPGVIKFYDRETGSGRVLVQLCADPEVVILKDFNKGVYAGVFLEAQNPVWVTIQNSVVVFMEDRYGGGLAER